MLYISIINVIYKSVLIMYISPRHAPTRNNSISVYNTYKYIQQYKCTSYLLSRVVEVIIKTGCDDIRNGVVLRTNTIEKWK